MQCRCVMRIWMTYFVGISRVIIAKVALRYVDAQTGALRGPKLLWVLKLTLGVMVSGNAADDD